MNPARYFDRAIVPGRESPLRHVLLQQNRQVPVPPVGYDQLHQRQKVIFLPFKYAGKRRLLRNKHSGNATPAVALGQRYAFPLENGCVEM